MSSSLSTAKSSPHYRFHKKNISVKTSEIAVNQMIEEKFTEMNRYKALLRVMSN